jgi:hypothetical protein
MIVEGIILRGIGVLSRTINAIIEIDAFDIVFREYERFINTYRIWPIKLDISFSATGCASKCGICAQLSIISRRE